MSDRETRRRQIGSARVVADVARSDGMSALQIHNFVEHRRGVLDATLRILPVAAGWSTNNPGKNATGLCFAKWWGLVPRLLVVDNNGEYELDPSARDVVATGVTVPPFGTRPVREYAQDAYTEGGSGALVSLISVSKGQSQRHPPQFETVGNRVYFTRADGSGPWVWDGNRKRTFGFNVPAAAPTVEGPQRTSSGANAGGFSIAGRIGTTDNNFTGGAGVTVGGIDDGLWRYYMVLEGTDGAYSATSTEGGAVLIRLELAGGTKLEKLSRQFWVRVPKGPPGTAARILLRTPNLRRLPSNSRGEPQFLHRIPNNIATDWIDDIPDGELGPVWRHRASVPVGVHHLRFFAGSLFLLGNDGHPSRVWWSEQENLTGPTPESFMEGHWRDVFPQTGEIRGTHLTQLAGDRATPVMLIFKPGAVHTCVPPYPHWSFGTLHQRAGLAGPNLVQSTADGSVVWFGSQTFWRLSPDGAVQDIGGSIRHLLVRVDARAARMGQSWFQESDGTSIFVLPIDDEVTPSFQFIYDPEAGGFRTAQHLSVKAVVAPEGWGFALVSGSWDGDTELFALGRSHPNYTYAQPTWRYQTGWHGFSNDLGEAHATWKLRQLIVSGEESRQGRITTKGYRNWGVAPVDEDSEQLTLVHPEDDTITFYGDSTGTITVADEATFGDSTWRHARYYTCRVDMHMDELEVFAVELTGSDGGKLVGIEASGMYEAAGGVRTPRVLERA